MPRKVDGIESGCADYHPPDPLILYVDSGRTCVHETHLMSHQHGGCRVTAKPFMDLAAEAFGLCGCSGSEGEVETIGCKLIDSYTNKHTSVWK